MVYGVYINGRTHRTSSFDGTPLRPPPINGFTQSVLPVRHTIILTFDSALIYYEFPCRSSYSVTTPVRIGVQTHLIVSVIERYTGPSHLLPTAALRTDLFKALLFQL
jgi:hypothetical protein